MASLYGQYQKKYLLDLAGGCNLYLGARQVKDNESPNAINCDFIGKGGIKNRDGYTQIGTVTDSRTIARGLSEFHTPSIDQAIKFASNGTNTALGYGSGGAWTWVTTDTFDKDAQMDVTQAGDMLYTGNGVDTMKNWNGTVWATTSNGTVGLYPVYYDNRLWVVDEVNKDTINFSGKWASSSSKLGDFVDASAGTITIRKGSGIKIRGMINFKNALYVWLFPVGIFRITPASAANTFDVTLITNSIGCVSHRSIRQVGEDVWFASDDGVYSLGDVANYASTEPRTTNKSIKVEQLYNGLSAANKKLICAEYYNFKYHLFYSLGGTSNDSCLVYDVRYQGWQDWRGLAATEAQVYTKSSGTDDGETAMYFIEPLTGKVNQLYSGSTDAGAKIASFWYSKSFDENMPDVIKKYTKTTFVFDTLQGSATLKVIFDDSEVAETESLSQARPDGGFGYQTFGVAGFGNTGAVTSVTVVVGNPLRMKAKGRKFAIQYYISSSDNWQINSITQLYKLLPRKFPSQLKLN
jgi:hypothetical protein